MEPVEVVVNKSKEDIVTQLKERTERLFNVSVSLSHLYRQTSLVEDGNSLGDHATFTFRLSSPDSQENVEKAIVFLKAALEESPDFMRERNVFQQEHFEMVRRNSQAIEHKSLAVLDFDGNTFEVCMKGDKPNVKAAKEQICALINQHDLDPSNFSKEWAVTGSHGDSSSHKQLCHQPQFRPASSSPVGTNTKMPSSTSGKGSSDSPVRDLDNNVIIEPNGCNSTKVYSLNMDTESGLPSDSFSGSYLVERGSSDLKTFGETFSQILSLKDADQSVVRDVQKQPPHASDCSSSSSEDNESGVNFIDKSDRKYESKLEFAVKLGYSEQDLDRVLHKHGLNCDFNKLLRELIEGSTTGVEETELVESPSTNATMSDFVSSEEFLGVMKKVTKSDDASCNLRHIVIDGSNVAMSHGKNIFSCRGIKIAVDWFSLRGHKEITVFVPQWRKESSRPDTPITDQEILLELEREGVVVFTPARRIKGRRVVCYDDRFVLKLAAETDGIVVSNDIYRDLLNENQEYRTVVEERLLMYTFVNDRFMPPEDPLGRRGPTLDNFLRKEPTNPPPLPPECPYGRKCTYGNKCKFHHPERGTQPHRTVTEVLKEQAIQKMQERATNSADKGRRSKPKLTRTHSLVPVEPLPSERLGLAPLPPALQDPDPDPMSRQKSLNKTAGKTADYLREHRKRLEEALAVEKALDAGTEPQMTAYQEVQLPRPMETSSPRLPDSTGLTPAATYGSRVSSPSRLNVPYSDRHEGGLVSGHLLLAKKLSDEASDASFFSTESSSNRASPVALAGPAPTGFGRQESMPVPRERNHDRRLSLQEAQRQRRQHHYKYPSNDMDPQGPYLSDPSRLPSHLFQDQALALSAYGSQCQSFPMMERGTEHGALRRVTSYVDQPSSPSTMVANIMPRDHPTLKPQQSCPLNPFFTTHSSTSTGRPLATMMRQNSSSDPQLHVTASDPHYGTWQQSHFIQPAAMMETHSGHHMYTSHADRAHTEAQARQNLLRSTSMQPLHQQSHPFSPSLDRQISEVMYGQHESYHGHHARSHFQIHMDSGSLFQNPPSTPTHPGTPIHLSPNYMAMQGARGGGAWMQEPLPMPTSPVRPIQRSYPKEQPIPTTDPRYPLYYHLCGIFAEPRVRAAMNNYPDETDPQKLLTTIMQIQL